MKKRAWLAVSTRPPPRGEEPLLVEAMRRLGARAVEREGERFEGYFPEPPDPAAFLARVEAAIRGSTSVRDPELRARAADADDWARLWGPRSMGPIRVSDRLIVTGAKADDPGVSPEALDASPEDPIVLRLHPGPSFGSAEHPTTRSCLRLLDRLVRPGTRLLDVGSGSGILAIGAALMGARRVIAVEMDEVACGAARANADLNGVAERIEVRRIQADATSFRWVRAFDGVVANIEPVGLRAVLPGLFTKIRSSGWLLLSGGPAGHSEGIIDLGREHRFDVTEEVVEEGWWTGVLRPRGRGPVSGRRREAEVTGSGTTRDPRTRPARRTSSS